MISVVGWLAVIAPACDPPAVIGRVVPPGQRASSVIAQFAHLGSCDAVPTEWWTCICAYGRTSGRIDHRLRALVARPPARCSFIEQGNLSGKQPERASSGRHVRD